MLNKAVENNKINKCKYNVHGDIQPMDRFHNYPFPLADAITNTHGFLFNGNLI
jgi:hypothetical protein